MYASADDELVVAPEDLPGFCSNVLPMLEERMSVAAPAALDALRPRDARFAFYFDRTGSGRTALGSVRRTPIPSPSRSRRRKGYCPEMSIVCTAESGRFGLGRNSMSVPHSLLPCIQSQRSASTGFSRAACTAG